MSKSYTGGLNFSWPEKGDTNWDATVDAALTTISAASFTGGGTGTQLTSAALAANSATGAKVRLGNNETLRALNAAGNADVDLLKLTNGDILSFLRVFLYGSTETVTTSTGLALTSTVSVLNGSSIATTLANGTEGQVKLVVNIASTNATVTPATTAGANTVTLLQHGVALYQYIGSEWRVIPGPKCVVTDDVTTITTDNTYTFNTRNIICNKGSSLAITLSNGVENQEVNVVNIGVGTATITPSTTAGTNTATVTTNGHCRYTYMSGEWRAIAGAGCTLA